jgi:4-amino-4-deoxy-L-arabinose transferase-like glycosyltransferase
MGQHRDLLFVILVTGLALLLRLWHINADLWLDEIMTLVNYMRLPPLQSVAHYNEPNQHFLNSFLGSISIRLLGETTFAIRLPALLFGVLTIPVFYRFAALVTQRREAIAATLLLTFSYHHVWFSQNARGYTAMIFFTVLSSLLLFQWLTEPGRFGKSRAAGYLACGGLGMFSLLNYAFVLAGQFLTAIWVLAGKQDRRRIWHLLAGGLIILVLGLLGIAAALPELIEHYMTGANAMGWAEFGAFLQVVIQGLTGGLHGLALPAVLAGAVIALAGWVSYWRNQRLIALMLVLPAAFNIAALLLLGFSWFPRFFLYVLPFGILTLVRGVFVLGEAMVRKVRLHEKSVYALPAMLIFISMILLSWNYRYPKQDYTGPLAYVRAMAMPGDVIAVAGYLSYGYRNYYAPELVFVKSAADLESLPGPDHRTWVLYSFVGYMQKELPDVLLVIRKDFEKQAVFPGTLGDGTVYVASTAAPKEPRKR